MLHSTRYIYCLPATFPIELIPTPANVCLYPSLRTCSDSATSTRIQIEQIALQLKHNYLMPSKIPVFYGETRDLLDKGIVQSCNRLRLVFEVNMRDINATHRLPCRVLNKAKRSSHGENLL